MTEEVSDELYKQVSTVLKSSVKHFCKAFDCKLSKRVIINSYSAEEFVQDHIDELSLDYNLLSYVKFSGDNQGHCILLSSELIVDQAVSFKFPSSDNTPVDEMVKLTTIDVTEKALEGLKEDFEKDFNLEFKTSDVHFKDGELATIFKNVINKQENHENCAVFKATMLNHSEQNELELILYVNL